MAASVPVVGTRPIEFVGLTASRGVVDGYDAVANQWSFSFDSPFWKAVNHAHDLDYRGVGHRVAIIDSGCDVGIQRLRRLVDTKKSFVAAAADEDVLGHGTAVALLISEVAPEARLDIYQVARDGRPDERAVINALNAAADSNADIINLSIAVSSDFAWTLEQLQEVAASYDGSTKTYVVEEPQCALCTAAFEASSRGKLVFAAAGNRTDAVSHPARAHDVIAIGFQGKQDAVEALDDGGMHHAAFAAYPQGPQGAIVDLSLAEIPGVLGTSFAAPLFAGLGALGLSARDFAGYIAAEAACVVPQFLHGLIDSGSMPNADSSLVHDIGQRYVHALKYVPHVHCEYQARLNPHIAPSDPTRCWSCGFFVALMVNHGLWLLETGHAAFAESLLSAAHQVAPWNPDALANLAALNRERGNIAASIELYELALERRPGFAVYTAELERMRGVSRANRWWPRFWARSH